MSNKKDIVKSLSKRTFLNQKESNLILNELLKIIEEKVVESGEVKIAGFGKFYLYEHQPRPVRNPKTKEEMILDKFSSVKFKASSVLKERVKKKTS